MLGNNTDATMPRDKQTQSLLNRTSTRCSHASSTGRRCPPPKVPAGKPYEFEQEPTSHLTATCQPRKQQKPTCLEDGNVNELLDVNLPDVVELEGNVVIPAQPNESKRRTDERRNERTIHAQVLVGGTVRVCFCARVCYGAPASLLGQPVLPAWPCSAHLAPPSLSGLMGIVPY